MTIQMYYFVDLIFIIVDFTVTVVLFLEHFVLYSQECVFERKHKNVGIQVIVIGQALSSHMI